MLTTLFLLVYTIPLRVRHFLLVVDARHGAAGALGGRDHSEIFLGGSGGRGRHAADDRTLRGRWGKHARDLALRGLDAENLVHAGLELRRHGLLHDGVIFVPKIFTHGVKRLRRAGRNEDIPVDGGPNRDGSGGGNGCIEEVEVVKVLVALVLRVEGVEIAARREELVRGRVDRAREQFLLHTAAGTVLDLKPIRLGLALLDADPGIDGCASGLVHVVHTRCRENHFRVDRH